MSEIAVKPIDDEGYFPLFALLDHEDQIIRDGVLAKLAKRQAEIARFSRESRWHWSRFRGSRRLLSRRLRERQSAWQTFRESPPRSRSRHYPLPRIRDAVVLKAMRRRASIA